MRVYKCDRCGTYYDKKMFQPVEVFRDERTPMDICTDCYKELEKWIGVKYDDYISETKE